MRDSLPFSGKATGYARDPIPEADFPRPGEDVTVGDKKGNLALRSDAWGSLLYRYEHLLIHKNAASETLSSFFATLSPEPFVKRAVYTMSSCKFWMVCPQHTENARKFVLIVFDFRTKSLAKMVKTF